MELELPSFFAESLGNKHPIKVISCNVQWFRPDFFEILDDIAEFAPDVVAFQDMGKDHAGFDRYFSDWHQARSGQFWVGSRFPVRYLGSCCEDSFRKVLASFEVDAPRGTFLLHVVHLSSPREPLSQLEFSSIFTGKGADEVRYFLTNRRMKSLRVRQYLHDLKSDLPQLVMGDFNAPVSSNLYQAHWGDFQNAFDMEGMGYGYTFSCVTQKRWPSGVPWIRLDHILADKRWKIEECHAGSRNGSDHRLVGATLSLRSGH